MSVSFWLALVIRRRQRKIGEGDPAVGHQADHRSRHFRGAHAFLLEHPDGFGAGHAPAGDVDEDHVGLDLAGVDRQPRHPDQGLGQGAGVAMVLLQSRHHGLQGHQAAG
ncbi:MAG: hypothetical protein HY717_10535, partial [Planctomycetes bacterium]|nr:hypothetical protein [Planctomycetota bacterium]